MSAQSRTLLLDNALQPVKTITWQRAITLITLGKVEVIESYDGFVSHPTIVIKMPAVVRLLRAFKRFRKPVKFSRINIFARDNYRCQYCGKRFSMSELTYDHVIPRAMGGRTEWNNIVSCCGPCNGQKASRTPAQAKMKLLSTPVQPKWIPALEIHLSNQSTPDQWRDYMYWNSTLDS